LEVPDIGQVKKHSISIHTFAKKFSPMPADIAVMGPKKKNNSMLYNYEIISLYRSLLDS
jgi:uncharacterized membrane protein YfhO